MTNITKINNIDFSLLCLEILLTGSIVITFRAQFGQDYLLLVTHQCIAMVSLSFLSTLGNIGTLGKFVFPHLCKFITFVIFRLMVKFHFCQVHCPISFVISHPLANLSFLYLFCKFVIFVTFIFSANMPSSGYRFIIQSIMAFWQMTEK